MRMWHCSAQKQAKAELQKSESIYSERLPSSFCNFKFEKTTDLFTLICRGFTNQRTSHVEAYH